MEESGYESSSTNTRPSSSTNQKSKIEEPSANNNNNNNNDAGDFECNICFELAQDPIITLCGHLFCWPCLYRWLRYHSQLQECPVCKAIVQEDKLVPLYGRGKSTSDPRSRPVPGVDIPSRPPGQRPETAQPPHGGGGLGGVGADQSYFSNLGFGLLGGFMPMATARFGNMTMSAGFGGLFPSLFSLQFNGFPNSGMYGGAAHGFPYNGYAHTVHGHGHAHGHHGHGFVPGNEFQHQHRGGGGQGQDNLLKNLFLIVGVFVLVALFWS